MREVKKTRKFGGKTYRLHDWYIWKRGAELTASGLRSRGYNVRITFRPQSKKRGGYPLMDLWYVWKRKV
jgi:hypothetical protein